MAKRGPKAGSTRIPLEDRRVTLSLRLDPDVANWLYYERDRTGQSIGKIVDLAVTLLSNQPGGQFPPSE